MIPTERPAPKVMTATEMHDLLRDSLAALQKKPYWHFGDDQFSHISYCDYCGYSQSHGHDEDCVIARLEAAGAMSDIRLELRIYADHLPLAGRALAEIERLRTALVAVIAASDYQPCVHAAIAREALGFATPVAPAQPQGESE
jgi:hypothetical protein